MVAWDHVTRADVLRAIEEYDRLRPEGSRHHGPLSKFLAAIKCWTLTGSRSLTSMAARQKPMLT